MKQKNVWNIKIWKRKEAEKIIKQNQKSKPKKEEKRVPRDCWRLPLNCLLPLTPPTARNTEVAAGVPFTERILARLYTHVTRTRYYSYASHVIFIPHTRVWLYCAYQPCERCLKGCLRKRETHLYGVNQYEYYHLK